MAQHGVYISQDEQKVKQLPDTNLETISKLLASRSLACINIAPDIAVWMNAGRRIERQQFFSEGDYAFELTITGGNSIVTIGNFLILSTNDAKEQSGLSDKQLSWIHQNVSYKPYAIVTGFDANDQVVLKELTENDYVMNN